MKYTAAQGCALCRSVIDTATGRTAMQIERSNVSIAALMCIAASQATARQCDPGESEWLSKPIQYAGGIRPADVACEDVNGDTTPDLVVLRKDSRDIGIRFNQGDGNFGPECTYSLDPNPEQLALGDLNGDGHIDAVVTHSAGYLSVRFNDGAGAFNTSTIQSVPGIGLRGIVVADLNKDGMNDIACVSLSGNSIAVLVGSGDGSFAPGVSYAAGTRPFDIEAEDLNGDTYLDLAVTTLGPDTSSHRNVPDPVIVYYGDGVGGFPTANAFTVGLSPNTVAFGDIDSDGDLDMVTANPQGLNISWHINDGSGSFSIGGSPGISPLAFPHDVGMSDFNLDGHLDIAVTTRLGASPDTNNIQVFPGDGAGGFGSSSPFPTGSDSPYKMAIRDLNSDGADDIAVAHMTLAPNATSVLFGLCNPAQDCPADVNGDGMLSPTDFTAWIDAFNNDLPECDQNGDGSCTPTDFTAWIANFNAGC